MDWELYFTMGLLAFLVIAGCVSVEHFIVAHWLGKDSILVRLMRAFERKHPGLCDSKDVFYCFFKRDTLKKR